MREDEQIKKVMARKSEGKRRPVSKSIDMIDDLFEKKRYRDLNRRANSISKNGKFVCQDPAVQQMTEEEAWCGGGSDR